MKNDIKLRFIKRYNTQFIRAFFESFFVSNIYSLYNYAYRINRLEFDLYPDLPWEVREPLIKQVRIAMVQKNWLVVIIIILLVYFPLLMLRFKIDRYESIFNCFKRFKKEDEENNELKTT